jgi:hypothetical protein
MILAIEASSSQTKIGNGDIQMIQTNRTWQQFQHLQQGFENIRGIRLAYLSELLRF